VRAVPASLEARPGPHARRKNPPFAAAIHGRGMARASPRRAHPSRPLRGRGPFCSSQDRASLPRAQASLPAGVRVTRPFASAAGRQIIASRPTRTVPFSHAAASRPRPPRGSNSTPYHGRRNGQNPREKNSRQSAKFPPHSATANSDASTTRHTPLDNLHRTRYNALRHPRLRPAVTLPDTSTAGLFAAQSPACPPPDRHACPAVRHKDILTQTPDRRTFVTRWCYALHSMPSPARLAPVSVSGVFQMVALSLSGLNHHPLKPQPLGGTNYSSRHDGPAQRPSP